MTRTIVTYLLIAVVLICPYCCLGKDARQSTSHSPPVSCSCCSKPAPSDDQAPRSPDEGDPDCLCHGAIMNGSKALCSEATADEIVISLLDLDDDGLSCSLLATLGSTLPSHFPPFSTGRGICALTCALLL